MVEDEGAVIRNKRMSELSVGDQVLVVDQSEILKFSKVVSFLHKIESIDANFKRIHYNSSAEDQNKLNYITLTDKHLILVGKPQPNNTFNFVPAREVRIGDMLKYYDYNRKISKMVTVTKVENVGLEKSGIYSPLTEQGTIVVDNIHVSCYSMIKNHKVAQFFFNLLNSLSDVFKLTSSSYVNYSKILFDMLDFAQLTSFFLNI